VGFPMDKAGGRAALIALMLGGGLLYAGISQAQDIGAADASAERSAELAAASGGPASPAHLIVFDKDRAAVDARDDDVAPLAATPDGGSTSTPSPLAQAVPTPASPAASLDGAPPRRVASADATGPASR
jgi:hypothetical protein